MKKEFDPIFISQLIMKKLEDIGYKNPDCIYLMIYFKKESDSQGDYIFMRCDEGSPRPEANNDSLQKGSYKMWGYSDFSEYPQVAFFEEMDKGKVEHIDLIGKGIDDQIFDNWDSFWFWLEESQKRAIYGEVPLDLYLKLDTYANEKDKSKIGVVVEALREFFNMIKR